jgi:predicted MFS family arabinose efflux permease
MLKKLYSGYIDSFRGLPKEAWWLSLITLINRSGTMVIPFLSLYLTKEKDFTLAQVGWIMTAFGGGSVAGAYLGGLISDRIGPYKTMVFSLLSSGIFYILTQFASDFWQIIAMIFMVVLLADTFRPASFAALRYYTNTDNRTRSTSLIRLAINLGFSAGPAVGGYLIFNFGYTSLFWVDGVTSILAMGLMMLTLRPKKSDETLEPTEPQKTESAYKDKQFLGFILALIFFAFAFLQYFSTIPYYYSEDYGLSEKAIGILMGFNGFLVFIIEMPVVHYLEKKKKGELLFVFYGAILLFFSFLVLQIGHHVALLWIGMALMSFAEVIAFPFANSYALKRSHRGLVGQYMALFSLSFSIGHIFAHNSGFQMINYFGFSITWIVIAAICLIVIFILYQIKQNEDDTNNT